MIIQVHRSGAVWRNGRLAVTLEFMFFCWLIIRDLLGINPWAWLWFRFRGRLFICAIYSSIPQRRCFLRLTLLIHYKLLVSIFYLTLLISVDERLVLLHVKDTVKRDLGQVASSFNIFLLRRWFQTKKLFFKLLSAKTSLKLEFFLFVTSNPVRINFSYKY